MPSNRNKGRSPLQRALRLSRSVFADCVNQGATTWSAWVSAVRAVRHFNLTLEQKRQLIRAIPHSIRVGALVQIEYDREAAEREVLYNAKSFKIMEEV